MQAKAEQFPVNRLITTHCVNIKSNHSAAMFAQEPFDFAFILNINLLRAAFTKSIHSSIVIE